MHKVLEKFKGNWTANVSTWVVDNGQPVISKAECTNTMILGDATWLQIIREALWECRLMQ
jgi:hypothetical protein